MSCRDYARTMIAAAGRLVVVGGGQIPSNQLPTISIFITQNHRKEYCSVIVLTGPKILVLPSLSPLNFRLG